MAAIRFPTACFAPVNKKVRETYQGIERAEELMGVGERAGDESEGIDTERDTPEGEDEKNIQGQRDEQPEEQQVDPCGSSTAPSGL